MKKCLLGIRTDERHGSKDLKAGSLPSRERLGRGKNRMDSTVSLIRCRLSPGDKKMVSRPMAFAV